MPAEGAESFAFAVLLHNELGERMPGAICRAGVGVGDQVAATTQADAAGWVVFEVPHRPLASVVVAWAPREVRPGDTRYPFYARYHVLMDEARDDSLRKRLENLGYAYSQSLEAKVRAFERDFDLPSTGELEAIAPALILFHDMGQLPARRKGHLSPPLPAPAPAKMPSYLPYGGGQVPGHGAVRAPMTHRRIRLANHENRAARTVRGEIIFADLRRSFTTDDHGVTEVCLPSDVLHADIRWREAGSDVVRRSVRMFASDENAAVGARLYNLGFETESLDEQMREYRRENKLPVNIPDEVIHADIRRWHDGGSPPGEPPQSDISASHDLVAMQVEPPGILPTGGKVNPRLITVCSNIVVDLFRDKSGHPPVKKLFPRQKGSKKPVNLWMLSLWKGMHTAISFDDFPKADTIFWGNPAVPNDEDGGHYRIVDGKKRHDFFHAQFMGPNSGTQISMLSVSHNCDIFQVHTHDWPASSFGSIELYGKAMALNAADVKKSFYDLTVSKVIDDAASMQTIVNMIVKEAPLKHLVMSAHGAYMTTGEHTEGSRPFRVWLGKGGLHKGNVDLFSKLKGQVEYIWMMSCSVGEDLRLMSRLAEVTGAWVVAHGMPVTNFSVTKGTVDWQIPAFPKVWKHALRDTSHPTKPIKQHLLFQQARKSASSRDFRNGLDFNVVRVKKVK